MLHFPVEGGAFDAILSHGKRDEVRAASSYWLARFLKALHALSAGRRVLATLYRGRINSTCLPHLTVEITRAHLVQWATGVSFICGPYGNGYTKAIKCPAVCVFVIGKILKQCLG